MADCLTQGKLYATRENARPGMKEAFSSLM